MRYVAAYLLAALSGNADPSTADIEKILSSVGIECNPSQLQKVMNELKGKDLEALIAEGQTKLASMPTGGAPAAAAGGAATAPAAEAKEAKKEEKKEESEEEDEDMGFGLFD
uniref:Large ribosomal subunit protein P2 n=1 Tax=Artemia salina TaxID=85549 RepID=RLA2_ARTSA|nr:RecName: Full=Large ribosomal subunit protein P2; AltName: Full=60S acidic ribosomal protein P2; AltName: Full=EL12 [Artemia salina]